MLGILNKMFDPTKRTLNRYERIANDIDAVRGDYENLSDDALKHKTIEFKERLEKGRQLMICLLKLSLLFGKLRAA